MKNLPDSKRHTSQTVAASKAEAKLRLDYYGIGQNPIAELDLDRVQSDAQICLKK